MATVRRQQDGRKASRGRSKTKPSPVLGIISLLDLVQDLILGPGPITPQIHPLNPLRILYCKCMLPYNPDEYMLQCQACKDWYHPACLNMTKDEAKLLDNFTCDREQCLDGNRPHNQSSD
ncbi:bromo adjacent homology domain, zinc finger, RING/FYVE/PHD-type containing protein [Tanacetum coccineum]